MPRRPGSVRVIPPGYGTPGDHGSVFEDLTPRAVEPDDALVVFFGSRNDQGVDPGLLPPVLRQAMPRWIRPSASSNAFITW